MSKKYLFLCTPNIGILDSWGPILKKLKRKGNQIDIIFPKYGVIFYQFNKNYAPCKILEEVFDQKYFKTPFGNWIKFKKIYIFENINLKFLQNKFVQKFIKLFNNKIIKSLEYIIFKTLLKDIETIDINKTIKNNFYNTLLYDVLEESKAYNNDWLKDIDFNKISYETGINFHIFNKDLIRQDYDNKLNLNYMSNSFGLSSKKFQKINNLKILVVSEQNKEYYKNVYNISEEDIEIIGIAKHDNNWINEIKNNSEKFKYFKNENYILIISRPAQEYFLPIKRKINAIKSIKKLADKYNFKIVVKLHPKENLNIGRKIYFDVLGKRNYQKKWLFSELNILQIAENSIFAFSFFTSTCLDLIKVNTPTIEYLDIRNIPEEDNKLSLRDNKNYPVLPYRYFNLTKSANSYNELEIVTKSILKDKNKINQELLNNYKKLIPEPKEYINFIH